MEKKRAKNSQENGEEEEKQEPTLSDTKTW